MMPSKFKLIMYYDFYYNISPFFGENWLTCNVFSPLYKLQTCYVAFNPCAIVNTIKIMNQA